MRGVALSALIGMAIVMVQPAQAEGQVSLGWGQIFSNDTLGDGYDRWRTGSFTLSHLRGPEWSGNLPNVPGQLIEYRLRAEVFTPANLRTPAAGDRPFAGSLTMGMHTHWQIDRTRLRFGAELVLTGPQTRLDRVQRGIHGVLNVPQPSASVLSGQIASNVYPTISLEASRQLALSSKAMVRPFVEVQAGVETFVRIGADVIIGHFKQGRLLLRDAATGQFYDGVRRSEEPGLSFVLGADAAKVFDSQYLPSSAGYDLSPLRLRLRAGAEVQIGTMSLFYGLTFLGPEFRGQPRGQLLGSIRLQARF